MARRGFDPIARRALAQSALMHGALLVIIWLSAQYTPEPIEFLTYEIELVSPPAARQAPEPEPATEEVVVERPEPEPTPPEPETEDVVPVEDPEPEPEEPEPEPEPEEPVETNPPEVADETVEAADPDPPPEEEPEVSGEDINVRMEGLQRDYPAYYNNIIVQIERCFRWTRGGNWETVIRFYINREGASEEVDFVQRSGSTAFDFAAMEAIADCAGGRARFGPLPDDLPYDRFPVLFSFRPRGAPIMQFPARSPGEVTFER